MIVFVPPRLAGPLAVAIGGLLTWYRPPDPAVRRGLLDLQAGLQKVARGGHEQTPFDPDDIARQTSRTAPLLVSFADAAAVLACSVRTIARRVEAGELEVVGSDPAARIRATSLEAFARVPQPDPNQKSEAA